MTTIPCPENLPWCTDHYSNGIAEDGMHRAAAIALVDDDPIHHNVQISKGAWLRDERLVLSWHTDGDSSSSIELRLIAHGLLKAAAQFDAIRDEEFLADLEGCRLEIPLALVKDLAELLRAQGVGGQA